MAISKTIIKLSHIESVIKVVADTAGTVTIGVATDLLKSNEELDGATPKVNIGAIDSAISNNTIVTVTRNGVLDMNLFENTENLLMEYGADPTNNTFDIVVTTTGACTVYFRLLKLQGYRPLFRPEQGVEV